MPNYLVTGGLGFIGSHLASQLLEDPKATVIVVDNLQGQVLPADYVVERICAERPGELVVQIESVSDFRSNCRFDTIFHLASVVGPAGVLRYTGLITESIVRDTYHVAQLAQRDGARLVNVSTSEVYGGGQDGLCAEDSPRVIKGPASARQEYAAAKLACEVALANLCRNGRLNGVTVRPFNVSGVRQLGLGGFVLPRFVGQALQGEPLTVFGTGDQVRAFTDVRDVAAGILLAGMRGKTGEALNVGNPANRTTILDLAKLVVRLAESASSIQLVEPKELYGSQYEDAADKYPDAFRLSALGWKPQHSLPDTVAAVIHWLRTMPTELMLRVAGLEASKDSLGLATGASLTCEN
jgi:UDP-glucose 4-epimerase